MVKRTVYIFINGLYNIPNNSRNWTGRATTWVNTRTPHKAEKVEYFTSFTSVLLFQKSNVRKLYRTMQFYKDWNIVLVGHSNGCRVITEMIDKYDDWSNIKEIHLVSAASEGDFNKNNFNKYIKEGRIGRISIYVSGKDIAIQWFGRTIIARFFGYRILGLHGPYNIDESIEHKITTFWNNPWDNYGHSTCFCDENFDSTMFNFIK